jgi:hypothetical protein
MRRKLAALLAVVSVAALLASPAFGKHGPDGRSGSTIIAHQ